MRATILPYAIILTKACWPRSVLYDIGEYWGLSTSKQHSIWAPVGPQLAPVGPQLGPSWAPVGPQLGPSWAPVGPQLLGPTGTYLGMLLGLPLTCFLNFYYSTIFMFMQL